MLADPAGEVRAAACETLGRIPGSTVPKALLQATHDTKPSVRRAAALSPMSDCADAMLSNASGALLLSGESFSN